MEINKAEKTLSFKYRFVVFRDNQYEVVPGVYDSTIQVEK